MVLLLVFALVTTCPCLCSMSGEMPDTVQISGNELKVLKVDDTVNTTFVCEVKNRIGTNRDQVTAMVRGELGDTNKRTPLIVNAQFTNALLCK